LLAAPGFAVLCPPGAFDDAVTEPLPARFQLSETGRPVALHDGNTSSTGTGAGGGRGEGVVTHDLADPPQGAVLVTTTLTPGLGPLLPRLRGIVAETGSVLSHLAILAREAGVPTVVGYAGARDAFTEGALVAIDGNTGTVTALDDARTQEVAS
jgi:pyruvate,water dikinase